MDYNNEFIGWVTPIIFDDWFMKYQHLENDCQGCCIIRSFKSRNIVYFVFEIRFGEHFHRYSFIIVILVQLYKHAVLGCEEKEVSFVLVLREGCSLHLLAQESQLYYPSGKIKNRIH